MSDSLSLDPLTRQKIAGIIITQSEKPAENQDWTGMYKAVSDFIQAHPTAGFDAGISYFFANAGDTNGQNPDAPSNFFIRTYYQGAARLQGVTLSDQQVQAVSGNIGLAITCSTAASRNIARHFTESEVPAVATRTMRQGIWLRCQRSFRLFEKFNVKDAIPGCSRPKTL